MSAPNPKITSPGGETQLVFSLGVVNSSLEGEAVQFEVWNSPGDPTADLLEGLSLRVLEAPPVSGDYVQDGRATTEGWVQVRVTGIVGDDSTIEPQVTPWTRVTSAGPLQVSDIPAGSGRSMEVRLSPPSTAESQQRRFALALDYKSACSPLGAGFPEAGLRGVYSGAGDPSASFVVTGGVISASDPEDGSFTLPETQYILSGVPHAILSSVTALDGDASDGTLATGESYWAVVSLGDSGVVVTKGPKAPAPSPNSDRPAAPAGTILLGWILRDEAGVLTAADVTPAPVVGRFGARAVPGSLLQRVVSGGRAIVGDSLARPQGDTTITFPVSTVSRLWVLGSGLFSVTSGSGTPPEARALPLYDVACDDSSITSVSDLRVYAVSRSSELSFLFDGTLAVDQVRYQHWSGPSTTVRVPNGLSLSLFGAGTGTGGRTVIEVEMLPPGGAWSSLFPSSGTQDRRPSASYAASVSVLLDNFLPEVLVIPSGALLRARVVQVPSGGDAPSGALLKLHTEG